MILISCFTDCFDEFAVYVFFHNIFVKCNSPQFMHTRELQRIIVNLYLVHLSHNSCIRAKCNLEPYPMRVGCSLKFHAYARSVTATYCVYYFNSRIFCDSISNIYFVLPILRHILPISYTSLVRISQCFYEYLYFAQGGLCLRPLY